MLAPIYRWISKDDGAALWRRERCVASVSADLVTINVPRGPTLQLPCAGVEDGRDIAARWWAEFDLPVGERPVYPWEQARRAAWPKRPTIRLPRGRLPEPQRAAGVPDDLQPFDSEPTTIGGFEQGSV